jgi:DAACS family dicarboxylate/amino acid:cation (Na+ or H+) symporter
MDGTPVKSGFVAWWHRTPLYLRIFGGMVLGVLVGMLLGNRPLDFHWCTIEEPANDLAIPSRMVLRLLGALAPAIILLAIIRALIAARFEARLIRLLVLNTVVAICVGLLVANVIQPGRHTHLEVPADFQPPAEHDILNEILENVPKSLLGPLTDEGKVLGVIFIAVAFGIALRRSRHAILPTAIALLELAFDAVVVILHWVIDLVPIAVFGLVASIVGTKGFGAFHALGVFVLAVLAALLLQAIYYLTRIRFSSWVRPLHLLRETSDALVMAFSTGSSTVTMPVTYECLRDRVGLREKSASMGALVGSNFNNDGTALYEAMAALFIAQALGQDLSLGQQLLVILTSIIASVGAAGIPEAGLVTMTLVFSAVHLPPIYIGLLLPVDWFLDRARTAINVMGDMNVSCILDGKTREAAELKATPPA